MYSGGYYLTLDSCGCLLMSMAGNRTLSPVTSSDKSGPHPQKPVQGVQQLEMRESSIIVRITYLWAYLNQVVLGLYAILFWLGYVGQHNLPEKKALLTMFLLGPLLGHFCLWLRWRFDLVTMADGSGPLSRGIFLVLAIAWNYVLSGLLVHNF